MANVLKRRAGGGITLRVDPQDVVQIKSALEVLTGTQAKEVMRNAAKEALQPVLERAKQNAPVNDQRAVRAYEASLVQGGYKKQLRKKLVKDFIGVNYRHPPGTLRDSLRIKPMTIKKTRVGAVVQTSKGFYKGDDFYAAFVELGTKKMTARPFMRTAFQQKGREALQILIQKILRGVENVLAGRKATGKAARRRK